MTLLAYYFEEYKLLRLKYGPMFILWIQVGDFYEMYQYDKNGPDLNTLSSFSQLVVTRKNKNESVSITNPLMSGFNVCSFQKYLKLFISNHYIIGVINQDGSGSSPKRYLSNIYSIGTYIESDITKEDNFVGHLYIYKTGKYPILGVSFIDVMTGYCIISEIFSQKTDTIVFQELSSLFSTYMPKELICTHNEYTTDEIRSFLYPWNGPITFINNMSKEFFTINFQNSFLEMIYGKKDMISLIEYLQLEKYEYGRISFIYLIHFIYSYNHQFIKHLKRPIIYNIHKTMKLYGNSIFQLNILSFVNKDSLYSIINKTKTNMGSRYLKYILSNPSTDVHIIQRNYNCINDMLENDIYTQIRTFLSNIYDIEKIIQKCIYKKLSFQELYQWFKSCQYIMKLFQLVKLYPNIYKIIPDMEQTETYIIQFINNVERIFNMDTLVSQTIQNIHSNIFNKGVFPEIDAIGNLIDNKYNLLELLMNYFSSHITEKRYNITIEHTNKGGYYLSISVKKYKQYIEPLLSNKDIILSNSYILQTSDILIDNKGNKIKLYLKNKDDEIHILKMKWISKIKEYYYNTLDTFECMHFDNIVEFIQLIDVLSSNAYMTRKYNYCKPTIIEKDYGSIQAVNMRNPIVEIINEQNEYIPHSVTIGEETSINGMLLFGINSSGKSTLMKSIAMNIIMAQCGFYVPSCKFTYSIYNSFFTRISSEDNIFKHQSSFTMEMTELNMILENVNAKSFVYLDELVKSTEYHSSLAINTATVELLSQSKCSFVSATHLHQMLQLSTIKHIKNLGIYHLEIKYDEQKDQLIFNRELKSGAGRSEYGILVAKHLIENKKFASVCQKISDELNNKKNYLIVNKKSKYNSKVYMTECFHCKSTHNLHTHHIEFQKNSKDGFLMEKPHIRIHSRFNLMVLCEQCHHLIHSENTHS